MEQGEVIHDLGNKIEEQGEIIHDLKDRVEELQNEVGIHGNKFEELNPVSGQVNTGDAKTDDQGMFDSTASLKGEPYGIKQGDPVLDTMPLRRSRMVEGQLQRVAFGATITPHNYGPLGAGQIVQFDQVLTNDGNGYHAHSGIFTAPVGGVYVFHVSIAGMTNGHLQVMVNGAHKLWLWVFNGQVTSQTMIVNLNTMDEVYVSNLDPSSIILGVTYSTFSGFLLYSSD